MSEREYILTESELYNLLKSSLILQALSQGGVDDWEWAGDSITDFKEKYKQEHNIETFDEDGYLIEIDIDDIAREELKNYQNINLGKWIQDTYTEIDYTYSQPWLIHKTGFRCSKCKTLFDKNHINDERCPHCGAIMYQEEKNGQLQ